MTSHDGGRRGRCWRVELLASTSRRPYRACSRSFRHICGPLTRAQVLYFRHALLWLSSKLSPSRPRPSHLPLVLRLHPFHLHHDQRLCLVDRNNARGTARQSRSSCGGLGIATGLVWGDSVDRDVSRRSRGASRSISSPPPGAGPDAVGKAVRARARSARPRSPPARPPPALPPPPPCACGPALYTRVP
jgi:hypothetical protein